MNERELDQLKLISEYVKFHIGLYLATPPLFMVVAQGLGVDGSTWWRGCLFVMMLIYLASGISAGWFMGEYINSKWDDGRLAAFAEKAYSPWRRLMHHWLYWIGLFVCLFGLLMAARERGLFG